MDFHTPAIRPLHTVCTGQMPEHLPGPFQCIKINFSTRFAAASLRQMETKEYMYKLHERNGHCTENQWK
jgi:hypothetical protein